MDEAVERSWGGAVEALRSVTGMRLVVWPGAGVRAGLEPDRRLADLSAEELAALRSRATALTGTERLIEREGEWWLVQQTGPAWAEPDEASADLCGLAFTRLDGSQRRHAVHGRPPGPPPPDDELRRILEGAIRAADTEGLDPERAEAAAGELD